MTLLKSKTAENASHYELENMQHRRKKRSHWENEAEEKKRGGKTQMEAKGCCCSEQRKHQGNLAAGQFREGSRQKGVGLECTFFQNRGSTLYFRKCCHGKQTGGSKQSMYLTTALPGLLLLLLFQLLTAPPPPTQACQSQILEPLARQVVEQPLMSGVSGIR